VTTRQANQHCDLLIRGKKKQDNMVGPIPVEPDDESEPRPDRDGDVTLPDEPPDVADELTEEEVEQELARLTESVFSNEIEPPNEYDVPEPAESNVEDNLED